MARIFLALILLIPLSAVALWLRDHPGSIEISWIGYRISLSTLAAALILAALLTVVMVLSVLLHGIMSAPEHIRLHNRLSRYEHGLDYITRGLSAYAMGDNARALKELKKASRALPKSPLPHLLAAQSGAQLKDGSKATPHLQALLEHPATAYIGFKRLLEQAKKAEDTELYAELLKTARKEFPHDIWLAERFIAWCLLQNTFKDAHDYLNRFSLSHALPRGMRRSLLKTLALITLRSQHSTHAEDFVPFLKHKAGHEIAALSVAQYATNDQAHAMLRPLLRACRAFPSYAYEQAIITLLTRGDAKALVATKKALADALDAGKLPRLAHYLANPSATAIPENREGVWQCQVCQHVHTKWHGACHACDALESLHYTDKDEAKSQALAPATVWAT